ncbi:hypothetical protein [Gloeocapsopsis sp. IPPAS B-1203]|uniref:hypothetical protein n=1 Tax=Gloeocapsopsis sp. IPPAS B-1203 TaxID=2049454 RepID=UPI00117FFB2D|nr:hypothetical protein [Gloeocapsopsis sp. IPPAS B-1203]
MQQPHETLSFKLRLFGRDTGFNSLDVDYTQQIGEKQRNSASAIAEFLSVKFGVALSFLVRNNYSSVKASQNRRRPTTEVGAIQAKCTFVH